MKRAVNSVVTMGLALAATILGAAPPEDEALVQSAIGYQDPTILQTGLEMSRRRVADAMSVDPDSPMGAVVVFARGLDSTETATFAESYELAVLRAEAKVYVRATNVTETMSFGSQSLFLLDDPLAERLEKLIGHQRGVFMAMAQNAAASAPNEAAGYREAAYSHDIRFYKIEVVGPASSFDRIERSGETAALFVDGSRALVEQLAVERANVARRKAAGGIVFKGRIFGPGPLPPEVTSGAFPGNQPFAPPDPPSQQPRLPQQPAP